MRVRPFAPCSRCLSCVDPTLEAPQALCPNLRIPAPVESRKMLLNEPEGSHIRVSTYMDTLCPRAATFYDFVPSRELLKGLAFQMKFRKPSKIQAICMPTILKPPYRDMIVRADEGSGKTICAVLAMLSRVDPTLEAPQALCLCPTRDSALRVLDVVQKIAVCTGIKSEAAVNDFPRALTSLSDQPPFTAQVVVGVAATVVTFMYQLKKLSAEHLKVLVFHEAHLVLAQEPFKDFFLRLTGRVDRVNNDRQVLLFTETFNYDVESFMTGISKKYNQLLVNEEELPLESVNLYRVNCPMELAKVLVIKRMILDSLEGLVPITIFVGTKDRATLLHTVLHKSGHKVTNIQAAHSRDRGKILKDFEDGSIGVLISTLPLPLGFGRQKVNVVINYDLPTKYADPDEPYYEVFLQRTARAAGRSGYQRAVFNLLGTKKDRSLMEKIENHIGTQFAPVVRWDSVQEFKAALRSAGVVGSPASVLEPLPLSTALMWGFKAAVITDFAASRVTKITAAAAPDRKKRKKTLQEPKDSDIYTMRRYPYSDAMAFEYFCLSEELLRGLRDEMKFQKPSKIQRRSFPMIRNGPPYRDFIARAPDGSGKTTCSVIAMLDRVDPLLEALQALYVCPTDEWAIQTMEVVQKMGKYTRISSEIAVAMDCSENLLSLKEQMVTAQVVIGTPRTISERMQMFLSGSSIKILVFDGADCLYDKERSRNESLNIRKQVKQVHQDCQVLLFSKVIKDDTLRKKVFSGVDLEKCDQFHVTEEEPLVRHFKLHCPDELATVLMVKDRFLESEKKLGAALISAGTRDAKSVLRNVLYDLGVGGNVLWPEDGDEEDTADELGDDQSLSAEQEKVHCVVNWKPPVTHEDPNDPDYEAYLRRVDRARFFGRKAAVFNLLFTEEDRAVMAKIESRLGAPAVEVAPWDSVEAFNQAIGSFDPPARTRTYRLF